ncbi:DUF262 domain-containing protein [Aeromonas hydrophila]|uniref:DUF262 domain-containing protein n=2 Tax=Gammaproteobacteria TaxID=1236 RepID=UPI0023608452|nr:DUF262 domain-containing HNH endonuclease family protein [Aeromonas hydrophila]
MKTELFSISKIFTERLLRIPDYQRGYAWTDKQLEEYWSDISQIEPGQNHYVGVLTLECVDKTKYSKWNDDVWIIESKNYEPLYVVDGQQRLTTTIILIQCILESINEKELNYTSPNDIRKKFIFESKDRGISRSYLFGYEVDNPSYEFLKQNIFGEQSDKQHLIQETIYTNNLLSAKNFFSKKLKLLDFNEIELLYSKITQNLLFNIYSMSEEIDVHVSFETMNNRGKALSHLELLKNRLIYLSTKLDADEHEKSKLRNSINECWKTIYHQLGRNKDNPLDDDVFLFNHFILFYGDEFKEEDQLFYRNQKRGYRNAYQSYLLEDIFTSKAIKADGEKKLTLPNLYRYVSSLKSSVETWYEISNPKDSTLDASVVFWLEKINRTGLVEFLPLIMVAFQKVTNYELLVTFLTSLEKVAFRLLLLRRGYSVGFDMSRFIDFASSLSNGEATLDKIIIKLDDICDFFIKNENIVRQVSDTFKDSSGFYGWHGLRYFMYEYEQELKKRSKTYTDKLDWKSLSDDLRDHKTIEHIYPQNPRNPEWTNLFDKYSSKEKNLLRHSIGNLLPLSHPKNSSFQNKPFSEKIGKDKSVIGYKYGSLSEIEVSNELTWSAVEILNRGVHLLTFMEKRWGLSFKGVEGKINFLHLEFVLKKENLIISGNTIKAR